MECRYKISVVTLILLISWGAVKAQSNAFAFASATIVTPVTINFNPLMENETVANNYQFKKYSVTAAELLINGSIGDIYSITYPVKLQLENRDRNYKLIVELCNDEFAGTTSLKYGSQKIKIIASIPVQEKIQFGRLTSPAYDVTVNFN